MHVPFRECQQEHDPGVFPTWQTIWRIPHTESDTWVESGMDNDAVREGAVFSHGNSMRFIVIAQQFENVVISP